MDVNELLKTAHSQGASDLHLKVGSYPILRINGELSPYVNRKQAQPGRYAKNCVFGYEPGTAGSFQKEKRH